VAYGTNVYIDTNVFISAYSRDEKVQYTLSRKFLNEVIKGEKLQIRYSFFTSGFTLLELVANIRRKTGSKDKTRSLAWQLKQSWKNKIAMIGFKTKSVPKFFEELVETAIELGITTGDTIHSQLIMDTKMDYLITWNKKDFLKLRKKMKHLEIMTPPEFLKMVENMEKRERTGKFKELLLDKNDMNYKSKKETIL